MIGLFAGLAVYQITYFQSNSARIKCPKSAQKESLLNMLKLYPSLLGQELAESAFLALVLSATVSNLGMMETAVYSLLESIGSVVMLPIYAYASASQTLSLQQYFAGERKAAFDTVKKGIAISVCFAGVLLRFLCILPKPLMRLILEDAAVIHSAVKLLLIFSLVILIKAPYHVLMSFLQGVGKERFVLIWVSLGSLLLSIAVIAAGTYFKLWGIYTAILSESLLLCIIYCKTAKRTTKEGDTR